MAKNLHNSWKNQLIKVNDLGLARFRGTLRVPRDENVRKSILEEAHRSKFLIHPRMIKM